MSSTDSDSSAVSIAFQPATSNDSVHPDYPSPSGAPSSLKRPASPGIDDEKRNRKRKKEENDMNADEQGGTRLAHSVDGRALVDDLSQELQCGCCAGLVYKPVVVVPCDHFFCGSCCTLWVKNGGTNCPSCRSVSTAVMPSRPLQSMVDVLLRAAPHLQRPERERMQADEIYPVSRPFRIPIPREPSPEPAIPTSSDFLQPCPHCSPNNSFHWTCPQPIADPPSDPDHAWRIDAGAPPGHGFCGNCESILALQAPSTSRCDFCQVSFCGISVQGRCIALPIPAQTPHGMMDVGDLIQSPEIYDCFEGNTTEVELMLDYLTTNRLSPKQMYRQIAAYIQSQPEGFRPLIEQDLFTDLHIVPAGTEPDLNVPRRLICRLCATEVFLYGLRDWWIRERRKAVEEGKLEDRKDCPDGESCSNIRDPAHTKEFNHLIAAGIPEPTPQANTSASSASSSNTALNRDISPPATSSLFLPPISSDFPPTSSADLPSISNLVPELTRPRFNLPNDMFSRFIVTRGERLEAEQRANVATSSDDAHSEHPSHARIRSEGASTVLNAGAADIEFGEPSSSQSQRSVEAHLTQLAGYGSETGSDEGEKRGHAADAAAHPGVDPDARLEAYYSAALARTEMDMPEIRRTHSPAKVDSDLDVPMADDRPATSSPFASFHFYPDLVYGPTESNTAPTLNGYPVQVE